jgi:hypothetical protein
VNKFILLLIHSLPRRKAAAALPRGPNPALVRKALRLLDPGAVAGVDPGLPGCNPIAVLRSLAEYHAFPAQAGIHITAGVASPEEARPQKTFKLRCLAKRGSRLFAGTAREFVTMLVDANWVTLLRRESAGRC